MGYLSRFSSVNHCSFIIFLRVGALWRSSRRGWSDEMAHRGNMNTSSISNTFGRFFPNNFSLWEHLQKNWTMRDLTPFSIDFLFAGHEPDTIVLMVMYVISFVTGLVGNIMALWVLTRRRNRLSGASATRRLLVNLAVCDMMVVCVCMPVNLGHQVYNAWVFGDFLCRAVAVRSGGVCLCKRSESGRDQYEQILQRPQSTARQVFLHGQKNDMHDSCGVGRVFCVMFAVIFHEHN